MWNSRLIAEVGTGGVEMIAGERGKRNLTGRV